MKKVPKKNISKKIRDIRRPGIAEATAKEEELGPEPTPGALGQKFFENQKQERKPTSAVLNFPYWTAGRIFWAAFILIVAGGAIFLFKRYYENRTALERAAKSFEEFQSRVQNESSSKPGTNKISEFLGIAGIPDINAIPPLLKNAGRIYKNIQEFSVRGLALTEEAAALQNNWPEFVFQKKGDKLIASLEGVRENIAKMLEIQIELSSLQPELKNLLPIDSGEYLSLELELSRAKNFLDTLISWLKSPEEHRLLVFFYNPSEIRPGGGFLGSYAELIIRNANAESIEVYDINDADRELQTKIIPPKQLQLIVKNWCAADANWFFDFADSAQKTIAFLEASAKYRSRKVLFEGAFAITPKVISDLLALSGPIELGPGLVIDKTNFVTEIQKQVQIKQASRASYPKQILQKLTPLLLAKLTNLEPENKKEVPELLSEWIQKKDFLLYFKNSAAESFLDVYNLTNRVFSLPQNFYGDYLAVVNANIGGGKSDLFIKQKILLQSQLTNEGSVNNHLVITRKHEAKESDQWWYRTTNQNYLKIFTPPGVMLINTNGSILKKISQPVNYKKEGYSADPQVEAVESTLKTNFNFPEVESFIEYGKNVFAGWSKTPRGETSTLIFDYSRRLPNLPAAGETYQFIFEKQTGAQGDYKFEISAPVGFRFKENSLPVFEYETDDPPGRLILTLTLEKVL